MVKLNSNGKLLEKTTISNGDCSVRLWNLLPLFWQLEAHRCRDHPATIPLYGFDSDLANHSVLFTPYLKGGTLRKYVGTLLEAFPSGRLSRYAATRLSIVILGVSAGISVLHSLDLIHCDIKPDNVRFSANVEPVLTVSNRRDRTRN
jgi:serine/threonine protein kinase